VFAASAIVLLAIFAFMLFLSFSSRVQAVSTNVVISEFRVRGPNGAADEFIELYNLSGAPVAIGGWKIRGSNNAAGVSDRATITAGTISSTRQLRAGLTAAPSRAIRRSQLGSLMTAASLSHCLTTRLLTR
jgi:hypothetical protein